MNGPDLTADPSALDVIDISWDRMHVAFRLRLSPAPRATSGASEVSFVFAGGRRSFPVPSTDEGGGIFTVRVNVTTFAGRQAIPDGTWRIQAHLDGLPGPTASYDGENLAALDAATRVFSYDADRSALTVSYGVAERADDATRLDLLIHTRHLHRSEAPRKRRSGLKRLYARTIYRLANRLVGPKKGRILFASDQQPAMEGNLLRVHERMIERGLDTRFDLRVSTQLAGERSLVSITRILCLMATSEIILLDDYYGLLELVTVDRRTRVIQLWHAGSGFKSVGYSRFGTADSPTLTQPHRQYTFAICGSEHLRPVYAEAFGIEESAVIPTGLPRIDWFLDEARTRSFIDGFYAEHPHLRGKRVILFAPTFRGSSHSTAFYDFGLIDFDALDEACPPDTVVLFRMHPFIAEAIAIPEKHRDRFFDFTRFPDGLGLLHITDVLITDYSSIIYEFSLLDRPMLFFAPDKTNYSATRGFHVDYEQTAPGPVCETFDDLMKALAAGDIGHDKRARFRAQNFDRIDTGSADRVIDRLILDTEAGQQ